jgi:hypothetical protein
MVGLMILFICSGVFTVPSEKGDHPPLWQSRSALGEKMLLDPGLHWSFPYPSTKRFSFRWASKRSGPHWLGIAPPPQTEKQSIRGALLESRGKGYAITAMPTSFMCAPR